MRLLEKRKDFILTAMMDSMTLLMIGSKQIGCGFLNENFFFSSFL